ncbi:MULTISPECIES: mechanosensitive ion channel family protein [Caproicibacterium]|uniref:Mechanosensitive ion channel family protein n=1 Tax=Caproicibacterium argilliputei TaxID=3030016 RepID=A0AA97D8I8_9FIRM|nr:mechanosensitive ion channel family protein [Caproicibacterium argilliputei]WOC31244.1 mechanosensitive ion channel family protein [Caproicibacterium argilliputei]
MNIIKTGEQFLTAVGDFLPRLLAAAVILVVGWALSKLGHRLCEKALEKADRDVGVIAFLASGAAILIKIIAIIMALSALGLDTNVIVGAFSAVGLGISLALKENMANIACGIQMLFTKPFRIGDYIAAEDVEGTVERVELMFTSLRTFDNKEVVFPNSKLADSVITNYTAQEKRRLDMDFSIAYSDDLQGAKALLQKLAEQNSKVQQQPAPLIAVKAQADSAVVLTVRMWCQTEAYWDLYYEMQESVKLAFDANGYHIPFPQLDVHTDKSLVS